MEAIRWLQNEKVSKVFGARYSNFETFSSVVSNVGEKYIWQFQILQNFALYFVLKNLPKYTRTIKQTSKWSDT